MPCAASGSVWKTSAASGGIAPWPPAPSATDARSHATILNPIETLVPSAMMDPDRTDTGQARNPAVPPMMLTVLLLAIGVQAIDYASYYAKGITFADFLSKA